MPGESPNGLKSSLDTWAVLRHTTVCPVKPRGGMSRGKPQITFANGVLVGRWKWQLFAAILRALRSSLLSSRGIRGCAVDNENLLGATTMGPLGAFRCSYHGWVLVGDASYCRSAQSEIGFHKTPTPRDTTNVTHFQFPKRRPSMLVRRGHDEFVHLGWPSTLKGAFFKNRNCGHASYVAT